MHKQTFPYEEIGKNRPALLHKTTSRIYHLGQHQSLRGVFKPPFFIIGSTQVEQISFGMGGSGPSGCLLLPSYEAYLSEEPV